MPNQHVDHMYQIVDIDKRAGNVSQLLGNSVIESPSPLAQSPSTRRVKPTLGCSTRHASTNLSRAALLTADVPRPTKGRSLHRPTLSGGDGSRRHQCCADHVGIEDISPRPYVGVHRLPRGPMAGVYTNASMAPSCLAASAIDDWHDSALVTSHAIAMVSGPASWATTSRRSRRRAMRTVRAPRWANPIPMQRPSPLDAPTTTVLMSLPRRSGNDVKRRRSCA
jgi:hypothetical protein